MGYTTDFSGDFKVTPPLKPEHCEYLKKFSETRRMKRDPMIALEMPDPVRHAVELPIGDDGCYFVGSGGMMGQDNDKSVLDYNTPPGQVGFNTDFNGGWAENERRIKEGECQPGLWCDWTPNEDGTAIEWNQGEKFYYYIQWLQYLIAHFLDPWGYKLNGEVRWVGESPADTGTITVTDNEISIIETEGREDD